MSIIHEALKKVEASGLQAGQPKSTPLRKNKAGLKIAFIYAAVALLGFISANFIFSFFASTHAPKAHTAVKPAAQRPAPPLSAAPPPAPSPAMQAEKKEPPQLTLNGIFFSGKEGYALINNQIVREGDQVGGATVQKITIEGVELKYDEAAVNLSSQGR